MKTDRPCIFFKRLDKADADIALPRYMTNHAAGMDIYAAISESLILEQGQIRLIPSGFAMALPPGYEAQIRPRSGLAIKHGVTVINSPGTIDADYRGEIKIGLINLGPSLYTIHRGERIAQMVIQQVCHPDIKVVSQLDETLRNDDGFGSTGLF
ncbi:MAG: dUTP diphosphatase [Desulfobacteraceae bacterium]|nr:dUTP diphosphatase [Desulfobacteraceae bacterium]